MLFLAIALHAVSIAAPPPQQARPAQVRTVRMRKARAKQRVARARLPVLRAVALTQLAPDPSVRYRIAGDASVDDAKLRAASSSGMACGVTGAPVCPSKPRTIVSAELRSD